MDRQELSSWRIPSISVPGIMYVISLLPRSNVFLWMIINIRMDLTNEDSTEDQN